MRNVRDSRLVGSEAFALAKSRVAVSKPLSQAEWRRQKKNSGVYWLGLRRLYTVPITSVSMNTAFACW